MGNSLDKYNGKQVKSINNNVKMFSEDESMVIKDNKYKLVIFTDKTGVLIDNNLKMIDLNNTKHLNFEGNRIYQIKSNKYILLKTKDTQDVLNQNLIIGNNFNIFEGELPKDNILPPKPKNWKKTGTNRYMSQSECDDEQGRLKLRLDRMNAPKEFKFINTSKVSRDFPLNEVPKKRCNNDKVILGLNKLRTTRISNNYLANP